MRTLIHSMVFALIALPLASAVAAPVAFSVNSDQPLGDTLHSIDLTDGKATAIGFGVTASGALRKDIEGLAIAPDGSLWGVDEDTMTLFKINTAPDTGTVFQETERSIKGMDSGISNDFGLTFTCDGSLFASSVIAQSLYALDLEGNATRIGDPGALGVNISAIAAFGTSPVQLYGLGNGLLGDEGPEDNRSLYEINIETGTVTAIGEIGDSVAAYSQAGLAFDAEGTLWAITDRSQSGQTSQILTIDTGTGLATVVAATEIVGFESLAIAPPAGCNPVSAPDVLDTPQPIPTMGISGIGIFVLLLLLTGLFHARHRFI